MTAPLLIVYNRSVFSVLDVEVTVADSLRTTSTGSAGWWFLLAVLATLVVADWFFGSLVRSIVRGQAQITVHSEPEGARVFADTLELGLTPLTDASVPPGRYVLRVQHRYSQPHSEVVVVERGEKLRRVVALSPGYGELSLVSNPRGASVTVDGRARDGVTPLVLDGVTAGLHEITLALPKRKIARQQVEVVPDLRAELSIDLERLPLGELVITTQPANASIELHSAAADASGEAIPEYSPGMTLPVRSYLVRVSQPGYEPQEQRVMLRRGSNRLEFTLQQISAELAVTVVPAEAQVRVSAAGQSFVYAGPVKIPVGKVTVRAKLRGYRTRSQTLTLDASGATVALRLPRFDVTVGRQFRDRLKSGGVGPQVVVLDAGSFRMGDLDGTGTQDERPAHQVQLREPFALGVREVTNAEWQRQFGEAGDNRPVVRKTREQIGTYLRWLGRETGAQYRLPGEAEWEYAARAGTTAVYGATGTAAELCRWANVADVALTERYDQWETVACNDGAQRLAPVGSYLANAFGLYDMIGNASEWVADCWHPTYSGAPSDGRVWGQRCSAWVARGGAWDSAGSSVRVSHRERVTREGGELGFRVLREL